MYDLPQRCIYRVHVSRLVSDLPDPSRALTATGKPNKQRPGVAGAAAGRGTQTAGGEKGSYDGGKAWAISSAFAPPGEEELGMAGEIGKGRELIGGGIEGWLGWGVATCVRSLAQATVRP